MPTTLEPTFLKTIITKSSCHTHGHIANVVDEEIRSAGSSLVQALGTENASTLMALYK